MIAPSTKKSCPLFTGGNTPGIEMEARTANGRDPERNTAGCDVVRFVARHRNGIGNASKSRFSLLYAFSCRARNAFNLPSAISAFPIDGVPWRRPIDIA